MGAIGCRVEWFGHEWVMGFGDSLLSPATGALGFRSTYRRRFLPYPLSYDPFYPILPTKRPPLSHKPGQGVCLVNLP